MLHSWHYLPLGLANLLIAHYIRTVFTTSNIPMPRNIKSLNKSPLCWQTIEFTKQKFGMIGAKSPLIVHSWMSQTNCIPYYPLGFSTSFLHYPYVYNLYCVVSVWAVVSLGTTLTLLYTLLSFVLFLFCCFFCLFCFVLFFAFFCFVFVLFCFSIQNICTIKAKAT